MIAPNELKLFEYSDEELERYGIFKDGDGDIIGVKEEAPEDFKKAYEEYRAHCEKMEELGID